MPLRLFDYGQSVAWDLITPLQKCTSGYLQVYRSQLWHLQNIMKQNIKYWVYDQSRIINNKRPLDLSIQYLLSENLTP